MMSNHSAKATVRPNAGSEALIFISLSHARRNKRRGGCRRSVGIHPREPFSQVLPVCLDQVKEFFHVSEFNQMQLNLVGNLAGKHGRVLFLDE